MQYKIKNINLENKRSRYFKRSVYVLGKRLRVGETMVISQDDLLKIDAKWVVMPGVKYGPQHQLLAYPVPGLSRDKDDPNVLPPGEDTTTPIPGEDTTTPIPGEDTTTPIPGEDTTTPTPGEEPTTPIPGEEPKEEEYLNMTEPDIKAFPEYDGNHDEVTGNAQESAASPDEGDKKAPKRGPKKTGSGRKKKEAKA